MIEVKPGMLDNIAITYVAARTHTTSANMAGPLLASRCSKVRQDSGCGGASTTTT